MLILTRKSGQMLTIHLQGTLDPATPIGELFRAGPIEVIVGRIDGDKVRIGINAHPDLLIARSERETEEVRDVGVKRGQTPNSNRVITAILVNVLHHHIVAGSIEALSLDPDFSRWGESH